MNEVTKRFIEVYNWLFSEKKISGQKDFASKIGVSSSMITEIIKERSNVGISAIQNTVLTFGINSHWFLTGFGKKDGIDVLAEPSIHYENKIFDAQSVTIETQSETIETQRKYINHLEDEGEKMKKRSDRLEGDMEKTTSG